MYPKPGQILERKPKFRKGTIRTTQIWKKTSIKGWKDKSNNEKLQLLEELLQQLAKIYQKPISAIIYTDEDVYNINSQTIGLNKYSPSIISALHEFAHHIHGSSELKACRWSVWLFKEAFPGLYSNLKWEEHLLVKK